jgi:hypothetical protein
MPVAAAAPECASVPAPGCCSAARGEQATRGVECVPLTVHHRYRYCQSRDSMLVGPGCIRAERLARPAPAWFRHACARAVLVGWGSGYVGEWQAWVRTTGEAGQQEAGMGVRSPL